MDVYVYMYLILTGMGLEKLNFIFFYKFYCKLCHWFLIRHATEAVIIVVVF